MSSTHLTKTVWKMVVMFSFYLMIWQIKVPETQFVSQKPIVKGLPWKGRDYNDRHHMNVVNYLRGIIKKNLFMQKQPGSR